ncbi:uncharacterized protein L201_000515 [Kwoniella dendrophila CBS 6074]|uniref:Proline dehydrogenase n=1 Tax=Kwoniella dendrophila CBS 6074 TaxID=1295534 RepID=A0AAX4JJQ7_9TREE
MASNSFLTRLPNIARSSQSVSYRLTNSIKLNQTQTSYIARRYLSINQQQQQRHQSNSKSGNNQDGSSNKSNGKRSWKKTSAIGVATVSLSAVGIAMLGDDTTATTSSDLLQDEKGGPKVKQKYSIHDVSAITLLRSYLVWTALGIPSLVDSSPKVLDSLLHSPIPGVSKLVEFIVRITFFAQFIPGETALECAPVMEKLRKKNVGSALNYSAEADTVEKLDLTSIELERFHEVERALDVQGTLEQRMHAEGWDKGSSAFALKVTGLIDSNVLIRASNTLHRIRAVHNEGLELNVPFPGCPSDADEMVLIPTSSDTSVYESYRHIVPRMGIHDDDPGVIPSDMEKLKLLWDRLDSLADRARRNGVRLILDAEESYYEPALDGYVRLLSMKYNKPFTPENHLETISTPWNGPVIYGSYQCYLQRQPHLLAAALQHAEDNGYALGMKQVRGGYIVKEQKSWKLKGNVGNGPVWPEKSKTDACYNQCIQTILSTLKRQLQGVEPKMALSIIFGTHNTDSLSEIFSVLEKEGLATKSPSTGKLKLKNDVLGRVGIAQLYGMRDDLSDKIHNAFEESKSPMSLIFIAYGRLKETLPFLGRRAIENKSLMTGAGGAAVERRRVGTEIRRRLSLGFLG